MRVTPLLTDAPERPRSLVAGAHLTGMSEKKEPPLDRTPMWTLDELCAKLHTTPATVHTWRKRGTAPKAYRIGRHLLFEEADIRAWLKSRATTADRTSPSGNASGW
ncbi:helix-turn-helix transcriptional regulator [Georgenia yuyongxinii]|uniref:Helix-turn-helix domain-containing protein n=1 Tax=Georgenia yuyongxinii TaxID=2589797 RepID=A0A552WN43_9MICO|nr:helix-turn-helix domain-containing protein [Georgenia yuyongxinii]TRW44124.1 helix-turn-helix domain-containing protein [Georgenia yuyongxinii]